MESVHGNLNYVADVEPFGRPFLAPILNIAVQNSGSPKGCRVTQLALFSLRL